MSNYTLVQLALGLRDLLDNRSADLLRSKAGKFHAPALEVRRAELDALPPALTGGLALADDLSQVDAQHDGCGAAIYFVTEAMLRLPTASTELREAAQRVRDAFIPALAELQAPYITEAHRAQERRPLLKTLKADLQRFPIAGGGTLLEVATQFIHSGELLSELLSQRGSKAKVDRAYVTILRPKVVRLLNRLREDLVEELDERPELPRDLEQRVFGYFDTLVAMRRPTPPAATPSPVPPASPIPPAPAKS